MSDNLPARPERDRWLAEFDGMTTDQLKQELADSLGLTARGLLRCACLYAVLLARGVDLSGLKVGLIDYLPHIADGTLLPEVVVRFAGKASVIRAVGALPLADQARLSSGERVLLVVRQGGADTHRLADPLEMTPRQLAQVFGAHRLRSEAEQKLILDDRREVACRPVPEAVGKLKIDNERGGVRIGNHFVPWADLETALRFRRKPGQ